jgi:hypothetical protein
MPIFRKVLFSSLAIAAFTLSGQAQIALQQPVPKHFKYVVYGDTRFTDDAQHPGSSNPEERRALVEGIAKEKPSFIEISGDIALAGPDKNDWEVYRKETAIWQQEHLPVYPVVGNHELAKDPAAGLANFLTAFPQIQNKTFYSLRSGNVLSLVLDSSQDELTGPQGEWLKQQFAELPKDVDFVSILLHHPPYTSSSEDKSMGGGHSARPKEQEFAKFLEEQQKTQRARIVVFAGHVHNYEHSIHNGVNYFTSGGGGAHVYKIRRQPDDLYTKYDVNFHYLLVDVNGKTMNIVMHRLEMQDGKQQWSNADEVKIETPAHLQVAAAR